MSEDAAQPPSVPKDDEEKIDDEAALPKAVTNLTIKKSPEEDGWPTDASKYVLSKHSIGKGAFAKVYIAKCPSKGGKDIAIKIMDLEKVTVNLDHLRQEVSTMKLCKHDNVLTLYNCFTVKTSLWLIMPFMNMGSCLEVMKQLKLKGVTELKEEWISAILSGAVEGMAYLHKSGWIHRDIKSGNILIDNEANVVLADFGVAAITKKAGPGGSEDSSKEFRNTFAGTPCWMAPEVMKQAKGYSEKADIWSLGITTLELAKGYAPYAKERTMKVLLRTLQEDPPSLETYEEQGDTGKKSKDFSRDFHKFYKRLLQKEPSKRPNAKDILKERFLAKCKNPKAILMKELLPHLIKLTGEVVEETGDVTTSTGAPDPMATSGILDASLLGWVDPSKTGNKMFTHAQKAMKDGQAEQHKAVSAKFKDAFEDDDEDDD